MKTALKIGAIVLNIVLAVCYPLLLWFCLTRYSPRVTGALSLALLVPILLLRFRGAKREDLIAALRIPALIALLLGLGIVFDDARFMLALPVLINGALLLTFGFSLRTVPTIERFARMQHPELPESHRPHCRQATIAWCIFFFLNGAIAGVLALTAPVHIWATYTGGIAYALMGLMFAGEYILRRIRFREYGPWPHDRALAKLFPPREE